MWCLQELAYMDGRVLCAHSFFKIKTKKGSRVIPDSLCDLDYQVICQ